MITELKIAIEKKQQVSIRLSDGDIKIGIPGSSVDPARIKLQTKNETISIPLSEIKHVMRIIDGPGRVKNVN